ncbi:MAG: hypothetical protein AB7H80_17335 [Candidatus Kapaibacterium sp.]
MPDIPIALKFAFIGITAALVTFILTYINRAAGEEGKRKVVLRTALLLLGWLLLTAILASRGFLDDFSSVPPRFIVVFLPAFIAMIFLSVRQPVLSLIGRGPVAWLVGIQVFRLFLELILHTLYSRGIIPQQMTFEGLNFDIITGITAPIVAWLLHRNAPSAVRIAQIWNAMGLLLVLNILIISLLSAPVPFQVFTEEPANRVVAEFPFVWLPAFVVPCAILLHIWSLRLLRQKK